MNRLWIRLSMTFGLVLLVASFLPIIVVIFLWLSGAWELSLPAEINTDIAAQIRNEMLIRIPRQIAGYTIFSALLGTIAGMLASRSLVAPLNTLAEGAEQIGLHNLSYRVPIDNGSQEIKAVASAFNSMASELEQAESLRQNLLADVSHELRTPLTVIQGNLRAILDDVYPLDKEEVTRLYQQTRHLTRLVEDLHELAQAEAHALPLSLASIDLPHLISEVVDNFRPLAEEQGILLRKELLGKLPHLTADKARLTQAVYNLLSNAVRHTSSGGQVTLQVEQVEEEIQIRVIDTGEGIKAEHLPHIFDRFYRTDKGRTRYIESAGTGLGLAIVRGIARAHGGDVAVASDGPELGAQFTIQLPLR